MEPFDYTDDQIGALITAIYFGLVRLDALPVNLYLQTSKVLQKALYKGYGGSLLDFEYGSTDYNLLHELRTNIYVFSGAKTATQCMDIKSLMYNGDEILTLEEFKKVAIPRFEVYNGKHGYLESEYITVMTSAGSAVNFNYTEANKDIFPRLRSVAIIDENTAPECEHMNGVIASVGDPIWNHNIAPRHWRCRCHEERIDKYDEVKSTPNSVIRHIEKENDKTMSPLFKMNPGKDRIIFSNQHPYYDIGKKNKALAKVNFNLPIPDAK